MKIIILITCLLILRAVAQNSYKNNVRDFIYYSYDILRLIWLISSVM